MMRALQIAAVWAMFPGLSACNSLGPSNILAERYAYNEAIHYTNAEQTLANIVRVNNGENPTFVGPTEITDNATAVTGVNGGSDSIAGPSAIGALSAMASFTKQPIVKYSVSNGKELVDQISTPITLIDVFHLLNSNSPTIPLLVFSFNSLTPNFSDYFKAISIISTLERLGAIQIEYKGQEIIALKYRTGLITSLNKDIRQDREITCYGNQSVASVADRLWTQLAKIYKQSGKKDIFLHSLSSGKGYSAVLARSAQGSLGVSGNGHDIVFLSRIEIDQIIRSNVAEKPCLQDFYFLGKSASINNIWSEFYRQLSTAADLSAGLPNFRSFSSERALILIEESTEPPVNAFVAFKRGHKWFSIRDDDLISKRNFSLLSTLTIVAAKSIITTPTVTALNLR